MPTRWSSRTGGSRRSSTTCSPSRASTRCSTASPTRSASSIPYDALHIYEADIARRELIPVLARSDWENEIMRTRPAFGQGITGWAVDKREPVLANDAHLDSRVAFIPGTPAEPEALISIPLIARGSLKGALNVYRVGDGASFAEDEFELAKWFGDAAALALDNAQVRARLEHQAQTDSLTGLYNHRNFHERLRAELTRASRARDTVALLMFDIDEFKRVNDICGHGVGDEILVALGEMTASLVRTSDVVCRDRRRGVRRDHALLRRGRRARARTAPDRASRGAARRRRGGDHDLGRHRPRARRTPATRASSSRAPSRR